MLETMGTTLPAAVNQLHKELVEFELLCTSIAKNSVNQILPFR